MSYNLNRALKSFPMRSPVIFTYHINWKTFENFGFEQFAHVKRQFKKHDIDIEFVPILTDKTTFLEHRVAQLKRGVEKIVDKYNEKAHIVAWGFSGVNARGFISGFNGDQWVQSLLTIGTPNK